MGMGMVAKGDLDDGTFSDWRSSWPCGCGVWCVVWRL